MVDNKDTIPDNQGRVHLEIDEALNDSDKTITVPTNARWVIQNIHVELTSTATVGNRQLDVLIRDSAADTIARFTAGTTQAASLTYGYEFFPGAARETAVVSLALQVPIPLLVLTGGYTIRIYDSAAVAAAADDMIIQMLVQEWIEE